jgi:alkaline phosphatase isozyme conversion protein
MRPPLPVLRLALVCFAAVGVAVAGVACGDAGHATRTAPDPTQTPGLVAYDLIREFTHEHPARSAGEESERDAATFIAERFADYGYEPRREPFEGWRSSGTRIESANVVAVKDGESERRIVVGAHYDSRTPGEGAADNASGVAVLLELALRLRDRTTPYTIEFVAFGAEEAGWWGSRAYYDETVTGTRGEVVCMIDLDVSAGGDKLYAHGSAGTAGWPRDHALDVAHALGVPLQAQPGLDPDYPAGTAGDWSDHRWFRQGGIPFLWVEATNWEIGDRDGFTTTRAAGKLWHTSQDTVEFIDATFPGRLERQLGDVVATLERFLGGPLPAAAAAVPATPAPSPAMPQP